MPTHRSEPEPEGNSPPLVREILSQLVRARDEIQRSGIRHRAVVSPKALGVPMTRVQHIAASYHGRHDLIDALWATGWYEMRAIAALVADPDLVTQEQMDRWSRGFVLFVTCEFVCNKLWCRVPFALDKVREWASDSTPSVRGAGFTLLSAIAGNRPRVPDADLLALLPLVDEASDDEHVLVMKSLRAVMRAFARRSPVLHEAALATCTRLASRPTRAAQWLTDQALRDLRSGVVQRRINKLKKLNRQ